GARRRRPWAGPRHPAGPLDRGGARSGLGGAARGALLRAPAHAGAVGSPRPARGALRPWAGAAARPPVPRRPARSGAGVAAAVVGRVRRAAAALASHRRPTGAGARRRSAACLGRAGLGEGRHGLPARPHPRGRGALLRDPGGGDRRRQPRCVRPVLAGDPAREHRGPVGAADGGRAARDGL
ncbi:MAG: hypothetical protein AVDCRST_MAG48-1381, partial [uncultured Friedmanniella sp.]